MEERAQDDRRNAVRGATLLHVGRHASMRLQKRRVLVRRLLVHGSFPPEAPPAPNRVGSLRKVPHAETCFDCPNGETLRVARSASGTGVAALYAALASASAFAAAARDVACRARLRALASWPA